MGFFSDLLTAGHAAAKVGQAAVKNVNGATDLLQADVYFTKQNTVTVSWTFTERGASQVAAQQMGDRVYLTALHYGKACTLTSDDHAVHGRLREAALGWALKLDEAKGSPVPVPLTGLHRLRDREFTLTDKPAGGVDKHFQSNLFPLNSSSSGGSYRRAHRLKLALGDEPDFVPLSALALIASNQAELPPNFVHMMASCIALMERFYREVAPPSKHYSHNEAAWYAVRTILKLDAETTP